MNLSGYLFHDETRIIKSIFPIYLFIYLSFYLFLPRVSEETTVSWKLSHHLLAQMRKQLMFFTAERTKTEDGYGLGERAATPAYI